MPHRCDELDHLAGVVALAEVEVALAELADDVANGRIPEGSRRALHPHERAAAVDFVGQARTELDLTETITRRLVESRNGLAGVLAEYVGEAADHADLRARIDAFVDPARRAELGELLGPSIRDVEQLVTPILTEAITEGGRAVLEEAARQGTTLLGGPVVTAEAIERAELSAARLAAIPHHDLARAMADRYYTLPVATMSVDEVAEDLYQHGRNLSERPLADAAGNAVHRAHGDGRADTAATVRRVAAIYASELLDRNTCGPCSLVDGRRYANLDEARIDYPNGQYVDCAGGPRCRGTLVFVWETEEDPTIGDEAPPPPAPPEPGPDELPDVEVDPELRGDWSDGITRLRRQAPPEWAPATGAAPFDQEAWAARFRAEHGRRPDLDEYRRARAAHEAAAAGDAAAHEAMIREAGSIVRTEVERRLVAIESSAESIADAARIADLRFELHGIEDALGNRSRELRAMAEELRKAQGRSIGFVPDDAYNELRAKVEELRRQQAAITPTLADHVARQGARRARVTREVLGEVQEMGPTPGARHTFAAGSAKGKGTDPLNAVLDNMPRRWVDASIEHSATVNPLYVGNIQRGHYRQVYVRKLKGRAERVSQLNLSGSSPAELARVALHEFGHRVEHVVPAVRRLEHEFYRRRTMLPDGTPEPLRSIYKGNNRERAREDKFVELYMGKDYGNTPTSYYELLSMGHEALFAGRYGALATDADMADFVLGLLVMV